MFYKDHKKYKLKILYYLIIIEKQSLNTTILYCFKFKIIQNIFVKLNDNLPIKYNYNIKIQIKET